MSGIIVFLGPETAWILEAIHLRDIPISQRFALWYPASWLVKAFTISWVCASVERVIFQWHLECFFWLGGNGSNPRCREVERDIAAQGRAPREILALYPPSPSFFFRDLSLWDIQSKHTKPLLFVFVCRCLSWLVGTNKWWSKHGIIHLWVKIHIWKENRMWVLPNLCKDFNGHSRAVLASIRRF